MSRAKEIQRLISYAKGLGLKVSMPPVKRGDPAAQWSIDGTEITVHMRKGDSMTDVIMTFIHELGHHLHFVHEKNRKPDLKFEQVLDRYDIAEAAKKKLTKRDRKKILTYEKAGTKWWRVIYKDTNIKVPEWKLDLNMEFDIWQYEVFYETGKDPTRSERRAKYQELLTKWKPSGKTETTESDL